MVHWVGNGSNVIICLARDSNTTQDSEPSALYISYDDGDTYENKTNLFKVSNESDQTYATLEKFYIHPTYDTHVSTTNVRGRSLHYTSFASSWCLQILKTIYSSLRQTTAKTLKKSRWILVLSKFRSTNLNHQCSLFWINYTDCGWPKILEILSDKCRTRSGVFTGWRKAISFIVWSCKGWKLMVITPSCIRTIYF